MPSSLFAKAAGLKVIDVEPLPMIQFSSISTNLEFVQKHPDMVERFMKGVLEGIAFFKTRPDKAIEIIQRRIHQAAADDAGTGRAHAARWRSVLEPRCYPTMQAIANVYEEALRQDKEARKVNPMELWDLHHLRRLDDSGFIDELYGTGKKAHHGHAPVHAHGETLGKTRLRAKRAAPAVDHTDCDEECAATH